MHGGSASAGSQNYHVTPNEILLPSPEKKQALEKFTKEEDSSLLNISKDREHKSEGSSQISLLKRWVIIQKVVTKFYGF
jgi:hypothetical protein